jgi:hypothetical protein
MKGVPGDATREQIMQKAITAGLAAEADFAPPEPDEGFVATPEPMPEPEKSGFDRFKEFLFGEDEKSGRGIFSAPELNKLSMPAFKAGLGGLLTGDPEELKGIIAQNYPGAEFGEMNGQQAVRMPSGVYLLNPEGIDAGDIGRFAFDVAAFTPAGRITGMTTKQLAKGAAVGGMTETAQQAAETALGGEFDAGEVALEAAIGPVAQVAGEVVPPVAKAVKEQVSNFWQSAIKKTGDTSTAQPYEELAKKVESGKAERVIPEIMADPQIIADADHLGIDLNPAHYSGNRIYREMERSLKALPGSKLTAKENEAIEKLGKEADSLLQDFAGTTDKSLISENYRERMRTTIKGMEDSASDLYTRLEGAIPKDVVVKSRNILSVIEKRAAERGGPKYLSPIEQEILQKLDPATRPTYSRMVDVRKKIGDGIKGRGEFKDANDGLLRMLYGAISEDETGVAKFFDAGTLAKNAKESVKTRKQLEDAITKSIGADLSKSLMTEVGTGVRGLAKGDTKKFVQVMEGVPKDMKPQVAVAALNNIFSGATSTSKDFSLSAFVNGYEGLMRNKVASKKLFDLVPPEAKARMDRIYRISKGIAKANEKDIANPAGTAKQVIGALDAEDGILSRVFQVSRAAVPAEMATTSVGLPGVGMASAIAAMISKGKTKFSEAADRMLADPDFQKAINLFVKGHGEAAEKVLTRGEKFKKWLDSLPQETKTQILRQGAISYIINGETEEEQ